MDKFAVWLIGNYLLHDFVSIENYKFWHFSKPIYKEIGSEFVDKPFGYLFAYLLYVKGCEKVHECVYYACLVMLTNTIVSVREQ